VKLSFIVELRLAILLFVVLCLAYALGAPFGTRAIVIVAGLIFLALRMF
jgi:hypothetical protein